MKTISKIVIGICAIPALLIALPLALLKMAWEMADSLIDIGLDSWEKQIKK